MNTEYYKNLTQKELEELYIDYCKSTKFLAALDLLTHSNLRKNISLETIQDVANIMKQEYDDYYYYSIQKFNSYLQERTTFTKEFFGQLSAENHHNLINKAIKYGDLKTLEYLLTSLDLYKFWKSFKFDNKVLNHVMDYGHAEILDFFLSSSKVFIVLNYQNFDEYFIQAAGNAYIGFVDYFLNKAALSEQPSYAAYSKALATAANYGHLEIVQLIVESRESMITENNFNDALNGIHISRSFHSNLDNSYSKIIKYLLNHPKSQKINYQNVFYNVCSFGKVEDIQFLLNSPELNKHNDLKQIHYQNGFHNACYFGNMEVVKYLLNSPELKENANVNIVISEFEGVKHKNCVIAAILGQKEEVLNFLIFDMNAKKLDIIEPLLNNPENGYIKKMFEVRDLNKDLNKDLPHNNDSTKKNKI